MLWLPLLAWLAPVAVGEDASSISTASATPSWTVDDVRSAPPLAEAGDGAVHSSRTPPRSELDLGCAASGRPRGPEAARSYFAQPLAHRSSVEPTSPHCERLPYDANAPPPVLTPNR